MTDSRRRRAMRRAAVASALLVLGLISAGCGGSPTSPPPRDVALGAPTSNIREPIDGAALEPGQRYLFRDLLPGVMDVELGTEDPNVFPISTEGSAYVGTDAVGTEDVVGFLSADDVLLFKSPYRLPQRAEAPDPASLVVVPPGELLDRLGKLEFLTVIEPARPMKVGGAPATAIDVEVRKLPAAAKNVCGQGEPPCAGLFDVLGSGWIVGAGQKTRFALVELPRGRVLTMQNLKEPRAQAIVDGARFVEQARPPELASTQGLPYGEATLVADQTYGVVLGSIKVGAMFRPGRTRSLGYTHPDVSVSVISADRPPDLLQPAPFGYVASTEKLFGFIAPTDDLLVPEPGVDPRKVGPSAFARSRSASSGGAGGLPGVIAAQPWAEVVAGPTDVTVGGAPGRSVDVRLRPGAKSVPCTLSAPERGSCAVLVYSRSVPSIWLLSDRVLRVSDVTVAGQKVTVITSVDDDGQALFESLKLVELKQ